MNLSDFIYDYQGKIKNISNNEISNNMALIKSNLERLQ